MSHRHYGKRIVFSSSISSVVGHCEICGRRSAVLSRCDACGTTYCRACAGAAIRAGNDCPIDDCPEHTS